jgi:hypothetical protein
VAVQDILLATNHATDLSAIGGIPDDTHLPSGRRARQLLEPPRAPDSGSSRGWMRFIQLADGMTRVDTGSGQIGRPHRSIPEFLSTGSATELRLNPLMANMMS